MLNRNEYRCVSWDTVVVWNIFCGLKVCDSIGVSWSSHDSLDCMSLKLGGWIWYVRLILVAQLRSRLGLFFSYLFLPLFQWEWAGWGATRSWLRNWWWLHRAEKVWWRLIWRRGWDEAPNVRQEFALCLHDVAKGLWNGGRLWEINFLNARWIGALLVRVVLASDILYLLIRIRLCRYIEHRALRPAVPAAPPITDVHE